MNEILGRYSRSSCFVSCRLECEVSKLKARDLFGFIGAVAAARGTRNLASGMSLFKFGFLFRKIDWPKSLVLLLVLVAARNNIFEQNQTEPPLGASGMRNWQPNPTGQKLVLEPKNALKTLSKFLVPPE